ncbi:Protein of uncharacterised function (DUF2756) [Klebsiella pneumoniae]|nr:Protein of uncharacterised function (DUF2756) [Klebsiella pneumoniae]
MKAILFLAALMPLGVLAQPINIMAVKCRTPEGI